MTTHNTPRYESARTIAERWECSTDVARARLRAAGLARYDFGTRSHRWLVSDVAALEQAMLVGSTRPVSEDRTRPRAARRGPRLVLA